MPTPEIYAQMSDADLLALKAGQYDKLSDEGLKLIKGGYAPAEERPPGPGVPAGEAGIKSSFLQRLGQGMRGDVETTARMMPGMIPGPLGALGAGLGSLAGDLIAGESPNLSQAGLAAGTTGVLGGLGRLAGPLSKLRIAGTGKAKDAALAAKAVREAGTPLQPGGTVAELTDTMRGARGAETLGQAKAAQEAAIARQLPATPAPVDTSTRSYLDAAVAGRAPTPAVPPALSRESYGAMTEDLTRLGRQGFGLRGEARNSPSAVAAREQYGEQLKGLKSKVAEQGGPGLLNQLEKGRRDFSAGTELRRLFRPNTGEGPDRVLRPGGFNMQDLQERAVKRLPELQGRLGQPAGDDFLRALLRGGKPGEGVDRAVPLIPASKFGGMRINLPLQYLAGPQMDPRLIQMLMQGGGGGLLEALQGR